LLGAPHDEHEQDSAEHEDGRDGADGDLRPLGAGDDAGDGGGGARQQEPEALGGEEAGADSGEARVIRSSSAQGFRHGVDAVLLVDAGLKVAGIERLHEDPHRLRNGQIAQEAHQAGENGGSSPVDRRPASGEGVGHGGNGEREGGDAAPHKVRGPVKTGRLHGHAVRPLRLPAGAGEDGGFGQGHGEEGANGE
jgi:hypothetical protein